MDPTRTCTDPARRRSGEHTRRRPRRGTAAAARTGPARSRAEADAPVRVGLVEDQPVVVEGVSTWLGRDPRVRIAYTAQTLEEARQPADAVILDLWLGERLMTDWVRELAAIGRRVVAYSQFTGEDVVLAARDAGACAFVAGSEGPDRLLDTVLAVAADLPHPAPAPPGRARPRAPRLSRRERTAVLCWFRSTSKAMVARRMLISPHTVDMYIKRARVKYAQVGRPAPTKAEMLARAIEDGLVRPEEVASGTPGPGQVR